MVDVVWDVEDGDDRLEQMCNGVEAELMDRVLDGDDCGKDDWLNDKWGTKLRRVVDQMVSVQTAVNKATTIYLVEGSGRQIDWSRYTTNNKE